MRGRLTFYVLSARDNIPRSRSDLRKLPFLFVRHIAERNSECAAIAISIRCPQWIEFFNVNPGGTHFERLFPFLRAIHIKVFKIMFEYLAPKRFGVIFLPDDCGILVIVIGRLNEIGPQPESEIGSKQYTCTRPGLFINCFKALARQDLVNIERLGRFFRILGGEQIFACSVNRKYSGREGAIGYVQRRQNRRSDDVVPGPTCAREFFCNFCCGNGQHQQRCQKIPRYWHCGKQDYPTSQADQCSNEQGSRLVWVGILSLWEK